MRVREQVVGITISTRGATYSCLVTIVFQACLGAECQCSSLVRYRSGAELLSVSSLQNFVMVLSDKNSRVPHIASKFGHRNTLWYFANRYKCFEIWTFSLVEVLCLLTDQLQLSSNVDVGDCNERGAWNEWISPLQIMCGLLLTERLSFSSEKLSRRVEYQRFV